MQYPINEMFQTLQGEGYFTGVPAIFIRLQGCPVGCAWCDTKHTYREPGDPPELVRGETTPAVLLTGAERKP